jgi:hypothetical protein
LQPFFHSTLEIEVKEPAFRNASDYTRLQFLKNVIEVLPGSHGRSYLRQQLRTPLWVLMAITGAILLIACANVAGLLVARVTSRQKEIAVRRLAVGVGRGQLVQQLLVESLLLAAIGGALGLLIAISTDKLLLSFLPAETTQLKIATIPDSACSPVHHGSVVRHGRPFRPHPRATGNARRRGVNTEGPAWSGGWRRRAGTVSQGRRGGSCSTAS